MFFVIIYFPHATPQRLNFYIIMSKQNKHLKNCKDGIGFSFSQTGPNTFILYEWVDGGMKPTRLSRLQAQQYVMGREIPESMRNLLWPETKKQDSKSKKKKKSNNKQKRKWSVQEAIATTNNPCIIGCLWWLRRLKKINYYSNTYQIFSLQV